MPRDLGQDYLLLCMLVTNTIALSGCGMRGEDLPRPEVIERIRAIGVKPAAPVFALPTNPIQEAYADATVYAASPYDEDATVEPWTATSFIPGAVPIPASGITLSSSLMTREKKGSLYLHQAPVRVRIPFVRNQKETRLSFGLKIRSHGRTEEVIASLKAFPVGAAELAWTPPTVSVGDPVGGARLKRASDNKISLTAGAPHDEDFQVGWFVSSGEIYNRYRRATYWRPKDNGTATVIATVRGRTSFAFELAVVEVEVE